MEYRFNLASKERKALVNAISEVTGCPAEYKFAPTMAYEVNGLIIGKNGLLIGDVTQELLDALAEKGFIAEIETQKSESSIDRLTIEISTQGFTEAALDNLKKLVNSKATLIKKALGTDTVVIERLSDRICFPWFSDNSKPDEINAYTQFVDALCKMAVRQKRVVSKECDTDNDKFSFRVFLVRLGMNGPEYKDVRKILLSKLIGDSAYRYCKPEKKNA